MFRLLLIGVLALTLLAGCSDNARDKAATQALSDVRAQEQQLSADQIIALYRAMIDKYPQMKQATEARTAILRIERQQQELLFWRSAGQLLERVSIVLDGYQAFSGQLPRTLKDLDTGGYMFDSGYLAEILPEGAALYLELAADKGATRMWLQQVGQEQILSRTLMNPRLSNLKPDDLQALKTKWQEIAKVGRLTQVRL